MPPPTIPAKAMQAGSYGVVLDACVLANQAVCDLYLRLAEKPMLYVPLWSKDILDETHRTHVQRLGWPPRIADNFRQALESSFPEALVRGYEPLIEVMTNDAKDRHVLAVAVKSRATTIVTFNVKHFQADALKQWDMEVRHPSEYLLTLYSISRSNVRRKLHDIADRRRCDVQQVLKRLSLACPAFAERVLNELT